jgi:serine/threonine protein kinase
MAPEVLRSAVEPASDIWSAGVMAHQLLTGRFPFDDKRNPGNPSISKIWLALLSVWQFYQSHINKPCHEMYGRAEQYGM